MSVNKLIASDSSDLDVILNTLASNIFVIAYVVMIKIRDF